MNHTICSRTTKKEAVTRSVRTSSGVAQVCCGMKLRADFDMQIRRCGQGANTRPCMAETSITQITRITSLREACGNEFFKTLRDYEARMPTLPAKTFIDDKNAPG